MFFKTLYFFIHPRVIFSYIVFECVYYSLHITYYTSNYTMGRLKKVFNGIMRTIRNLAGLARGGSNLKQLV